MRIWILILACICNTLFRYKPFDFQFGVSAENHTSYATGQALSYLLLLGYVYKKDWYQYRLFRIVFMCAFSNLMDELFFKPLELNWNEIVFVLLVIGWEAGFFKFVYNKVRLWILRIKVLIFGNKVGS